MTQTFAHYCPRCGTPTRERARVCPTCGLPAAAMRRRSSKAQGDQQNAEHVVPTAAPEPAHIISPSKHALPEGQPLCSPLPPVPPSDPTLKIPLSPPNVPSTLNSEEVVSQPPPDFEEAVSQPDTQAEQIAMLLAPMQPSPLPSLSIEPIQVSHLPLAPSAEPMLSTMHLLASHIRGKRRTALLLVLVLFLLGAGGYLAFVGLYRSQAPIKNANMHISFTYAGMNVILFKMQQAQNFIDDPHTANNGMLRLHFQEQNPTTSFITWDYAQSTRLLIPGQPVLAPVYVQSKGKIAPGVTQTSTLDFVMPTSENVRSMSLQLGSTNEAQMLIPLSGQADLRQYQPQTRPQNGNMIYFGLDLTLTSSTTSLSMPNKQAAHGMEYLTFTMIVDNLLSQPTIVGSPFDYMRVKIGGKTFNPVSTTLPISFTGNQMGSTGAVTFLIPQNSASGTLLLISQDLGGNGQASANFVLAHAN